MELEGLEAVGGGGDRDETKMEDKKNEDPSPRPSTSKEMACPMLEMGLPSELMVKIFANLPQKDLISTRQTCTTLRDFVDKYMDFNAIVHEDKTDLARLYKLRIKDCLITKLLGESDLFQFPHLVRRLRFWGPITGSNFRRILRSAVDNEELSFTRFGLTQDPLFSEHELIPEGFAKLKSLELLGYTCRNQTGPAPLIASNAVDILRHTIPPLRKLCVNFNILQEHLYSISSVFFPFLANHSSIEYLNVSLIPIPDEEDGYRPRQIVTRGGPGGGSNRKWEVPTELLKDLLKINLKSLRLATSIYDYTSWIPLIQEQGRLVDFRVRWTHYNKTSPPNPPIHGICWNLYKSPIMKSHSTLRYIDLKGITLPLNSTQNPIPLDASIFANVENLRRLVLHRSPDDIRPNVENATTPSIINILGIPNCVEELEIARFRVNSLDLEAIATSWINLLQITLTRTGVTDPLGVHGGIIKSIMELPRINKMSITTLNNTDKAMNDKLREVEKTYGLYTVGDHIYFDFERWRRGEAQPKPLVKVPSPPADEGRRGMSRGSIAGLVPTTPNSRSSERSFFSKKAAHKHLREWMKHNKDRYSRGGVGDLPNLGSQEVQNGGGSSCSIVLQQEPVPGSSRNAGGATAAAPPPPPSDGNSPDSEDEFCTSLQLYLGEAEEEGSCTEIDSD